MMERWNDGRRGKLLSSSLVVFLTIALAACNKGTGEDSTPLSNGDKTLTTFSFASPAAMGTIDENAKTISMTVPFGTNVTALVATFTTTGASVKVGSTIQVSGTTSNDFTAPVVYIVTAADGTTATYTVTVSPSSANTGVRSSYTTTFPLTEDPISEGSNWINGETTGRDWKNIATTPGLAYGKPGSVSYDDPTAILSGTWTADQDVSATVHSINQTDNEYQEVELRLRSSLTAHSNTGYEINFRCLKTSSAYMQVVRWNGPLGDFTYLNSWGGSQYGVTEGDVVRARIVGNTITVYINGVQRGQVTDSTYASGAPGMGFYGKTTGNATNYGFTSFSVGNPTH